MKFYQWKISGSRVRQRFLPFRATSSGVLMTLQDVVKRVLRQRRSTPEIEGIGPKAIHMLREVGTETGNRPVRKVQSFGEQLLEHARLGLHVVEDQTVGHNVPVLDNLALFVP